MKTADATSADHGDEPPVSPPARTGWDPLVAISLIAGVGFTAFAEYQLARTIGAAVPVAVLLPLALDVYVVAAIRRARGRDIALSLVLMGTAQVSAHMLSAGVVAVSVPLVAAVSLLVPLVIWRVHALATPPKARYKKAGTTPAAVPEVAVERTAPAPVPVPLTPAVLDEVPPRPELEAVPVQASPPMPVRQPRRTATKRSTRKPVRRTPVKAGTGSFDEHVRTATAWLAADPELTGTDLAQRLGMGDSYGRRIKRAALDTPPASTGTTTGPERRPDGAGQTNVRTITGSRR